MLDEPMGSLDRSLRDRLPADLRAIFSDLGLTTIYVTHDQDEALSVADRVVILDAGRLVADGTPEQLWRHPSSEWVARFLGFRNVAPARLVDGGLETPWGTIATSALDHPPEASADASADTQVVVLLRAAGLVAAAQGPIAGIVRSRRFRGDHVLFTVAVAGAPMLEVEARGGELPAVGQAVVLVPLPGSACVLSLAAASGAGHRGPSGATLLP
jgi:thiamine transport system ATP-binding protein